MATRTKKWRLLLSGRNDGATNMALDEALLQNYLTQLNARAENKLNSAAADFAPPILRFYGWQPPCLSLGYAQLATREVDFEACQRLGIDWVRRPTGGRAILHDYGELTYSLVAGSADLRFGNSILEAYREISLALLGGLKRLGVAAEIAPKVSARLSSGTTAACFDVPSSYELTCGGRKLIGSAQARPGPAFLQQGTILLKVDVAKLFQVLQPPARLSRAEAIASVSANLTSIEEARGTPVEFEAAQTAFGAAFADHFQVDLEPSQPTVNELDLMQKLRAAKYANLAWNMERQRPQVVIAR